MTTMSSSGDPDSLSFGSRSFYPPHSASSGDGLMSSLFSATSAPDEMVDGVSRLRALYPFVDVIELPHAWSAKDKANYISLSDNNLKVHYKGVGKGHKDAAAVRATHPIPPACLLYYFEIKIISKGRDGYMGIGLAAQEVNMQRLPGWDKQSFGYHGDDGHSFNSSGTGRPYGPTFTTGDVIGCAYNLVENTCYYTKNGLNLGQAFENLPNVPLFPTVGLQTPGEEVEANFGMEPFIYDIEDDMKALRQRITTSIMDFPVKYSEWQSTLHKLVQSWLVHNGYCSTAEVFSAATRQPFTEDVSNIKQRLKIQKLVLSGKIGQAIELTDKLYPEVLRDNPGLRFALRCRQFIEMLGSADLSTTATSSKTKPSEAATSSTSPNSKLSFSHHQQKSPSNGVHDDRSPAHSDCNGNGSTDLSEEMETDEWVKVVEDRPPAIEDILLFGRELHKLSQDLTNDHAMSEANKKMLTDAFALMAYPDPEKSPVGWLLSPSEREVVCQQLNNAIVINEMGGSNHRPPLETIIRHSKHLLQLNGQSGAWLVDKL